jgi:hypothetical protein
MASLVVSLVDPELDSGYFYVRKKGQQLIVDCNSRLNVQACDANPNAFGNATKYKSQAQKIIYQSEIQEGLSCNSLKKLLIYMVMASIFLNVFQ